MVLMDPRFPIGDFVPVSNPTPEDRNACIETIAQHPAEVREVVASLPPGAIDKPYREGGWTGRQVVHHLVDSHMNAYIRTRLALTEDGPTVKPYNEARWADSLAKVRALGRDEIIMLNRLSYRYLGFRLGKFGEIDLNEKAVILAWVYEHFNTATGKPK